MVFDNIGAWRLIINEVYGFLVYLKCSIVSFINELESCSASGQQWSLVSVLSVTAGGLESMFARSSWHTS